jgi:hypothetical protein
VIIVDVFYWITMGATWFVMLMTFWRLKITSRYQAQLDRRNDDLRDIAARAMARADWALEGMQIALKYAGVEDVPWLDDGSPAEGHTTPKEAERSEATGEDIWWF